MKLYNVYRTNDGANLFVMRAPLSTLRAFLGLHELAVERIERTTNNGETCTIHQGSRSTNNKVEYEVKLAPTESDTQMTITQVQRERDYWAKAATYDHAHPMFGVLADLAEATYDAHLSLPHHACSAIASALGKAQAWRSSVNDAAEARGRRGQADV